MAHSVAGHTPSMGNGSSVAVWMTGVANAQCAWEVPDRDVSCRTAGRKGGNTSHKRHRSLNRKAPRLGSTGDYLERRERQGWRGLHVGFLSIPGDPPKSFRRCFSSALWMSTTPYIRANVLEILL